MIEIRDGIERAYLLDLGYARVIEDRGLVLTPPDASVSKIIYGSEGFIAPERLHGRPGDYRADVFSVGALWCSMLTGMAPPEPMDADPCSALDKVPLPPRLRAVLRGALDVRDRRHHSAASMAEALRAAMKDIAARQQRPLHRAQIAGSRRPPARKPANFRRSKPAESRTGRSGAPETDDRGRGDRGHRRRRHSRFAERSLTHPSPTPTSCCVRVSVEWVLAFSGRIFLPHSRTAPTTSSAILLFSLVSCIAPASPPSTVDEDEPPVPENGLLSLDLAQQSLPSLASEPSCDDSEICCPPGTVAVVGTEADDKFKTSALNRCHVTLGGDDLVIDKSTSGLHAALGGPGVDTLQGGAGPAVLAGGDGDDVLKSGDASDELYGQAGNDTLLAHGGEDVLVGGAGDDVLQADGGDDILRGGAGDDTLHGGAGDDLLIGGPGRDDVHAGQGDDVVLVLDPCELAPGETINGGPGTDTLRIPVTLAELQAAGVTVLGFEKIVVSHDPDASECGKCSCVLNGETVSCCNGEGTCSVDAGEGQLACECPPDLHGSDCSYDPAQVVFDEDPHPGCQVDDPGCWVKFDADSECDKLDMLAPEMVDCADFPTIAAARAKAIEDETPFELQYCIWYPTAEGQPGIWAPGQFPLLLFGAGNSFDEGDYPGLLSHVARNGVIAVSASQQTNSAGIGLRGEMLACLRRHGVPQLTAGDQTVPDKFNGVMAYGGHSRGGEAAIVATEIDVEVPDLPRPQAVIGLAPTSLCQANYSPGNCEYPSGSAEANRAALEDGSTRGLLILEGSGDGDRTGEGIALNDIAAPETSDIVPADAMIKSMGWTFSVPHSQWTGKTPGLRGAILGKSYSVAFLRWHLYDELANRPFFTGDERPGCVADPESCGFSPDDIPLFQQFREAGTEQDGLRRVVRYFSVPLTEAEGTGPVTPGPDVTRLGSEGPGQREWLRGSSVSMVVHPGESRWIDFRLDGFADPPVPLDTPAESLSTLSFRLAKVLPSEPPNIASKEIDVVSAACAAFAAEQNLEDVVVRVILRDADGVTSAALSSAAYRRAGAPDIGVDQSFNVPFCVMHTFWTTVRIPLADFVDVDRSRLTELRIEVNSAENGESLFAVFLDSVDLVGHALDPVCGDGVAEGGEDCDGPNLNDQSCETLGEGTGQLACDVQCAFDTSGCTLGECPLGDPGCPGGPCLETPTSAGVAAYWQEGRYCHDFNSVCREDAPEVWTCHDCTSMVDTKVGCPCLPNAQECPPELACFGAPPDLPGIDAGARGACWDSLEGPPDGYCNELCASTARICGSTVELQTMCLIPDCEQLGYCELQPGSLVCDRDALPDSQCVPACDESSCEPDQTCTDWGECWG